MLFFAISTSVATAQSSWTPGEPPVASQQPQAPPAASPNRWKEAQPSLVGGVELVVIGAAAGLGTHAFARANNDRVAAGSAMVLQTLNVAGWTLAGCGAVLTTIGTIHGSGALARDTGLEVAVTPKAVTVSGRF